MVPTFIGLYHNIWRGYLFDDGLILVHHSVAETRGSKMRVDEIKRWIIDSNIDRNLRFIQFATRAHYKKIWHSLTWFECTSNNNHHIHLSMYKLLTQPALDRHILREKVNYRVIIITLGSRPYNPRVIVINIIDLWL